MVHAVWFHLHKNAENANQFTWQKADLRLPEDSGVERSVHYLWATRKLRRDGCIHYPDYGDNPTVQPTVNFTSIVKLKTCVCVCVCVGGSGEMGGRKGKRYDRGRVRKGGGG